MKNYLFKNCIFINFSNYEIYKSILYMKLIYNVIKYKEYSD